MVCKQIRGLSRAEGRLSLSWLSALWCAVSSCTSLPSKPTVKTRNIDSVAQSHLADSCQRQIFSWTASINAVGGDINLVPRLRMHGAVPSLCHGALCTERTTVYRCAGFFVCGADWRDAVCRLHGHPHPQRVRFLSFHLPAWSVLTLNIPRGSPLKTPEGDFLWSCRNCIN